MAKHHFTTSAKHDFLTLAQHDPSILTWRHCTAEDIRRLEKLAGFDHLRAKRAFTLCLFRRTKYLTLSLNPDFEPKPECRERAAEMLRKRAEKKARAKLPLPPPVPVPIVQKHSKSKPSKLARFSF
jgi:hypothetical protein